MERKEYSFNELEDMRAQVEVLKKKIEKQAIVSRKNILHSMDAKTSDINRVIAWTIGLGVFALVYCTWFFWLMKLSMEFVIATAVMLALCLGLTIMQKVQFNRVDYSQGNLLETAQVINKMRRHYKNWYFVSVPMILVWYGYLLYEVCRVYSEQEWLMYFIAGTGVGLLIGAIVGVRMNNKVVHRAEEILSQIEELKAEE